MINIPFTATYFLIIKALIAFVENLESMEKCKN